MAEQLLNSPTTNLTELQTIITSGWQDGSSYRGTADILWSCTVTIFACVYTAIHLDIPLRHTSRWTRLYRRIVWAFSALLGPELVVVSATRQWRSAREITAALNSVKAQQRASDKTHETSLHAHEPLDLQPLGAVNGFWVAMGGFVVDISDIHDDYDLVTLTTKGAVFLAESGLLPNISKDQIKDRSKANAIGKILICIQASWMIVQCIVRHAAGYPLTLLELHTTGHVVCALCIYILWWDKPLDVEEPILVDISSIKDLVSLMVISTIPLQGKTHAEINDLYFVGHSEQDKKNMIHDLEINEAKSLVNGVHRASKILTKSTSSVDNIKSQITLDSDTTTERMSIHGFQVCYDYNPSDKDILRWELAVSAIKRDPLKYQVLSDVTKTYQGCVSTAQARNYIIGKPREDWERKDLYDDFWNFLEHSWNVLVWILPVLYGGVHLAAWNFHFPSLPEEILWKVSGIGVMAATPMAVFLIYLTHWKKRQPSERFALWKSLSWWFVGISVIVAMGLDTFFRIYLVVGSFISLRQVPLGVWAATPWLQNFPHI